MVFLVTTFVVHSTADMRTRNARVFEFSRKKAISSVLRCRKENHSHTIERGRGVRAWLPLLQQPSEEASIPRSTKSRPWRPRRCERSWWWWATAPAARRACSSSSPRTSSQRCACGKTLLPSSGVCWVWAAVELSRARLFGMLGLVVGADGHAEIRAHRV